MAKTFHWEWVFEAFSEDMTFMSRPMFGGKAAYLRGLLVMVIMEDPSDGNWNGILVPTEHEHHESLLKEFPLLDTHPVLKKWLYLRATVESFEELAIEISHKVASGDPRIGVTPKPKKAKSKSKKITKKKSSKVTIRRQLNKAKKDRKK